MSDQTEIQNVQLEENQEAVENNENENQTEASSSSSNEVQTLIEESVEGIKEILPEEITNPYHQRYYLRYGEGEKTTPLDLKGTKAFLEQMGFDGGELKQARSGKDTSKKLQVNLLPDQLKMHCSYCGSEIVGVEYNRLPDGRLRCSTCSNTLVTQLSDVEQICKRVLSNMDKFFGASINVPIEIKVTTENKIKKRLGIPLGTLDPSSMLILGAAIFKKDQYKIVLENGAPRLSLIATFAHELTHIWQYVHWDANKKFRQCPKSKRLFVYEGMAKWVEIQYLYLIGESDLAQREEMITRKRTDEYGIGFCLYESRYPLSRESIICDETPFTLDHYPL